MIEKYITPQDVVQRYQALAEAIMSQTKVEVDILDLQLDLEREKTRLLLGNTINGRNAEIRKAQLAEGVDELAAQINVTQRELITKKAERELAYRKVREAQDLIAVVSVIQGEA